MRTRVAAAAALAAGAAAAWAGPALLWSSPIRRRLTPGLSGLGRAGHVALTFDDGPDPASTPAILDSLDELGWSATFFLLGVMTEAYPEVAKEVVSRGHEIAVHGYEHRGTLLRTPRALTEDLRRAVDVIESSTSVKPHWYRPPSGELSSGALLAARRVGVETVMWTTWGRDWRAEATAASIVADLRSGVLDGGTVLLHDSDCTGNPGAWRATQAALPLLASHLAESGLTVGTLGQHRGGAS
jgi:peptidoglycan/xylan/chitin deacetylase (PgdA/CDA1 family)